MNEADGRPGPAGSLTCADQVEGAGRRRVPHGACSGRRGPAGAAAQGAPGGPHRRPAHESVAAVGAAGARPRTTSRASAWAPSALGGSFPLSPEEDAALLALGWRRPDRREGTDYVRLWPDDVRPGSVPPTRRRPSGLRAWSLGDASRDVLGARQDPPTRHPLTGESRSLPDLSSTVGVLPAATPSRPPDPDRP